ncbi:MAG: hypothetical protein FJY82_06685 [Candidatus Aminicenantes bacterium]|nr:hypothetical protein [Candidatus Aminicenantes bacterium]
MAEKTIALDLPPYRGEVAARFAGPSFAAALGRFLDRADPAGAEVLFAGRNRILAAALPDAAGREVPVAIKEFRVRGLKRLIGFGRASKAERAWRGALVLAGKGFATASPVAFAERRRLGAAGRGVFVAERISGAREIRALFREAEEAELRLLLAGLVPHLRRLHDAGLVHRDLSDGNILVLSAPPGAREFYFLDTNRVRSGRRPGPFGRARGLVRLGVPPGLQSYFLALYAGAPGTVPLGRSLAFWYRAGKRAFSGWIRLKKALRLRKIARALRIQ